MIDDAAKDPALLESSAWKRFCEAERAAERKELDVAVAQWEVVHSQSERHPWIDYLELTDAIAWVYIDRHEWDVAIEWLEREAAMREQTYGEQDAWSTRRDIARVLIRADRRDEARQLYEQNRTAMPDDIWLYSGAAIGWLDSGHDGAAALAWIDEGLALAKRIGDPERLVGQLEGLRDEALKTRPVTID